MSKLVIKNCGQLLSFAPLVKERRHTAISIRDLGILSSAWIAMEAGKVLDLGEGKIAEHFAQWPQLDAGGALVTPGLIDCHTHPIFAGDRSHEFAEKLAGTSYQDIAARGGGIKYSIKTTREADEAALLDSCLKRLWTFYQHGVTTVEAKSGYGQSVESELSLLRILQRAAKLCPQKLVITCLALHDIPSAETSKESFIAAMRDELLPALAKEKLADWVDAFVEEGYFSVPQVESFAQAAKDLGLKIRLHADEFSDSGAAEAAARWGAASADHVQMASDRGIKAMAAAGTVAVLLPGTSFYSKIAYAHAARYRDAGCAIALASDYNPGSCYISNLPFAASLGALYCGLSAAEAIVAVTWNAARALRLEHTKGALSPGYDADLLIHGVNSIEQWIADFGQTRPKQVLVGGQRLGL